jgi:hypothetical protein
MGNMSHMDSPAVNSVIVPALSVALSAANAKLPEVIPYSPKITIPG